jgi:2,4-dienoyl-CoA reductase-like NADH-dependent reductase (Old Yellow Enzyme family)
LLEIKFVQLIINCISGIMDELLFCGNRFAQNIQCKDAQIVRLWPNCASLAKLCVSINDTERRMESMFSPIQLGGLSLRNRVIKTGAFEGMSAKGEPSRELIEHHRLMAAGGVGMTTVAYCSISPEGRTYDTQLWMRPEISAGLKDLTDAVHREGAAASIQLGHCGYFADKKLTSGRPLGPSVLFNTYGLSFCRAMAEDDIQKVIEDFAMASSLAVGCGFDAIELHMGHGYLISQFLSPYTNRRRDRWGGDLTNRMSLAQEVMRAVRKAVGPRVPIICKINLRDGFKGGLELPEAIEVAKMLEAESTDALMLSGGFVSKAPLYMLKGEVPLREMIAVQSAWFRKIGLFFFGRIFVKEYPFRELFFLEEAKAVRAEVKLPLIAVGGIISRDNIQTAIDAGFEFVAIGRALIHDPNWVIKLQKGELDRSECIPCNKCIAEMDRGGVRCVLNQP